MLKEKVLQNSEMHGGPRAHKQAKGHQLGRAT